MRLRFAIPLLTADRKLLVAFPRLVRACAGEFEPPPAAVLHAVAEATAAYEINPAFANLQFTNAIHIPFNDSNLAGWIA